jgi:glycerophosphoryl diester phosphodiesterase
MIYAHRGASFELPENTIESFALALELGANALETDAHMTRDGRVVLSHDPTGERACGVKRAIAESSFSEVRAWDLGARFEPRRPGKFRAGVRYQMPLLEEALEAFPDVLFNVDAKQTDPDMVPALLRAVERMNASPRVRIASFSERNLRRVRSRGYTGETGMAPGEVARLMFLPRAALRWYRPAGNAAQVPRRAYGIAFDSQRAIDRFHMVGLRVDFWTIDDPEEARRLLAMGADGIMTDDVRAVARATS